MHYTEEQLMKLVEDVEREFSVQLAKAEKTSSSLSKSHEEEEKHDEKEADKEKRHAEKEMEHAEKEEEHAEKEAKHAEKEHEEHEEEAGEGEDHDYDDEDLEHMHKMYSSMSKGELRAHHDSIANIMKCAMEKAEDEDGLEEEVPKGSLGPKGPDSNKMPEVQKAEDEDGIEGQEPANSPGPKSEASDANGEKINKAEKRPNNAKRRGNGGEMEEQEPANSPGAKSEASDANGDKINKSEGSNANLLKAERDEFASKYEDLKKNFDAVAAFLTKLVEKKTAPAAKAITSLDYIAKGEVLQGGDKTLSKQEIHQILCKKSAEPTLAKSDRDAINVYYAGGQVDTKGISHLLK